jgi:hypothetical protein
LSAAGRIIFRRLRGRRGTGAVETMLFGRPLPHVL